MWLIWLIAAGIFFVAEIITVGFFIFWLGIGSLLAMLVSFITNSIILQVATFAITSCVLLFFTKPLAKKLTKTDTAVTNSFSLINKEGVVTIDINDLEGTGQVRVNGEIWSAKTSDHSIILKDTQIKVLKIDGVKLVVEQINSHSIL